MQQFHHGYMGVLDTLQHHQSMMDSYVYTQTCTCTKYKRVVSV